MRKNIIQFFLLIMLSCVTSYAFRHSHSTACCLRLLQRRSNFRITGQGMASFHSQNHDSFFDRSRNSGPMMRKNSGPMMKRNSMRADLGDQDQVEMTFSDEEASSINQKLGFQRRQGTTNSRSFSPRDQGDHRRQSKSIVQKGNRSYGDATKKKTLEKSSNSSSL